MSLTKPVRLHIAGCVVASILLLGSTGWASTRADATPPTGPQTHIFEIEAGPLAAALAAFERTAAATVVVAGGATLDGLSTAGVVGMHSAEQALALLLTGTGLQSRVTGVGVFALIVRVDEGLEVVGHAAYEAPATDAGTKTYTPLRDVPQAITVVTRAMIADQSMQSLADVVRYIPGVSMAQGEGNRDAAVFRGNSSTGDFFVDGIRDDVQYFRDLYNVERVEALKGPNAMIFGRGGAGG